MVPEDSFFRGHFLCYAQSMENLAHTLIVFGVTSLFVAPISYYLGSKEARNARD